MHRIKTQIIAGVLVAGLVVSGSPFAVSASSVTEELPAAGAARILNEGKSATVIRAEKIKATGKVDATDVITVTTAAMEATEKATDSGVITISSTEESTQEETDIETSTETPSAGAGDYAVETDGDQSHKSSSHIASSDDKEKEDNTVSADDLSMLSAGAGSEETASEKDDGEMDLVKAVTEAESSETEDFSNLVVANVSDFVYVRTEPSEDAEPAGKLYKDSVGEALEEAHDGWIKIKSGNTEGYVNLEYVFTGDQAVSKAKEVGRRSAKVITTTLYVRQSPSTEAEVVGLVPMDDILTVEEETDLDWVKVSIEEGDGYVSTDYVKVYTEFVHAESKSEEEARLKKEEEERRAAARAAEEAAARNRKNNGGKKNGNNGGGAAGGGGGKRGSGGGGGYVASGSGNGTSVANYALQFVGNPYVYGGSSLTNGTDCSGFVMSVYRNFGVSLPHSSGGDRGVGYAVSGGLANAQAGDIVCYSGHVGIYIGGGQIVHASTAKTGIKVSNANYRTPVAVRRIF